MSYQYNPIWHEKQVNEKYEFELAKNSKITLNTSLDNEYIYVRTININGDIEPYLWETFKNGNIVNTLLDPNNPNSALVPLITKIVNLETLIRAFYSTKIDDKPWLPVEMPESVTIN